METIKIINNSNHVLSTNLQNVIRKAVANIGNIDEVIAEFEELDYDNEGCSILPIYNNEDEFLFNVNLSNETLLFSSNNRYYKQLIK